MICNLLTWCSTSRIQIIYLNKSGRLSSVQFPVLSRVKRRFLHNLTYPDTFECHIEEKVPLCVLKSAKINGERLSLWRLWKEKYTFSNPSCHVDQDVLSPGGVDDVAQAVKWSWCEEELSEPKRRLTVPHLFKVNLPEIPGARSI